MIETIVGMVIGGLAVWYLSMKLTEIRIKNLLNEMLDNPEKAKQVAKFLKRVLKEYKNV